MLARTALACLLVASHPALAADVRTDLPDLGDESANFLSAQDEKKLGAEFMRQARQVLRISDDIELNEYIRALGARVVKHSDAPDEKFHFFVVENPTLNAFAVPGGYVGIYSGLIVATQSEDELAAVVAHEIAHITQRHIPRLLAQANRAQLPAMAAIIAAILVSGSSGSGAQALTALGSAAYIQNQLNFTRGFEEEADRLGIGFLSRAGYDPAAMPAFFERLQNWGRLNEGGLPEFLRTHPFTSSRISESRSRAERLPFKAQAPNEDFMFIRKRAEILTDTNSHAALEKATAQRKDDKGGQPAVHDYAYALALLRSGDTAKARTESERLLSSWPRELRYRLLRGDIELAANQPTAALAHYRQALRQQPRSMLAQRRYGEALMRAGQPRAARDILHELARQYPDDLALQQALARAAGEAGLRVEAHRAMAEYYFGNGDMSAALQQLAIARGAARTRYESASIDARVAEVKDALIALKTSP